jgi:hypothetical protein
MSHTNSQQVRLFKKQAENVARAKQEGYKYGQTKQKDAEGVSQPYSKRTKEQHTGMLNLYVTYVYKISAFIYRILTKFRWSCNKEPEYLDAVLNPEKMDAFRRRIKQEILCQGAELPNLEDKIDFFRFYILQSRGKITKNERSTLDSCLSNAEMFFAGFTERTGTIASHEYRQEVYQVSFSEYVTKIEKRDIIKKCRRWEFEIQDIASRINLLL